MRWLAAVAAPWLLILGLGCSSKPADEEGQASVELKPVTFVGLQEKLADWKGRVVVLDFWAYY